MPESIASLPASSWFFLLFLAATLPVLLFTAVLLVAFTPSGAGRAGWRNPIQLPRREGIASWPELHPAFPGLARRRHLVGHTEPAPVVQLSGPWPTARPAIARVVTDRQRADRHLVRLPLVPRGRPSEDLA